ncbi:MAG TPA: DoxX family protein [Thermoanaerobaculia bacterium]|nr:DoxX family protein [Thermoanaerobaculia bacterium]
MNRATQGSARTSDKQSACRRLSSRCTAAAKKGELKKSEPLLHTAPPLRNAAPTNTLEKAQARLAAARFQARRYEALLVLNAAKKEDAFTIALELKEAEAELAQFAPAPAPPRIEIKPRPTPVAQPQVAIAMRAARQTQPTKAFSVALWTAQVLLALTFLVLGFVKLSTPIAEMASRMLWAAFTPAPLIRTLGALEIAGAIGLLLPAVTRLGSLASAIAATLLALVMLDPIAVHLTLGETSKIAAPLALLVLSASVAWARSARVATE